MTNEQIARIIAEEFEVDCSGSGVAIWWVPPTDTNPQKFEELQTQITNRVMQLANEDD